MELMEDLDPEEARAVDPALKLMIDAVHRYDGYVVQSTGDGIFALFGAPAAHARLSTHRHHLTRSHLIMPLALPQLPSFKNRQPLDSEEDLKMDTETESKNTNS